MKKTIQSVYFWLPFLILLAGLFTKILIVNHGHSYIHDEVIVTNISRQPLEMMLDSISAEPHPPGFYFLLKTLPTTNTYLTRAILTSLNFLLMFVILGWGYRKKIIQDNNLQPGISLFLASYSFFEVSFYVKQDLITFPLFLLFVLIVFSIVHKNSQSVLPMFIALNIISVFIFFLSVIYYAYCALLIVVLGYQYRKKLKLWIFGLLQMMVITAYSIWLGFAQVLYNQGRFSWSDAYNSSGINNLSRFLTGAHLISPVTDGAVIVFVGLLVVVLLKKDSLATKQRRLLTPSLFIISVIWLVYYALDLFVRTRYVTPLFLFLSIIAGWGATVLARFKPFFVLGLASLLFINIVSFSVFMQSPNFMDLTQEAVKSEIESQNFMFLAEGEVFPYTFKASHPELILLTPGSVYAQSLNSAGFITKDHLLLDAVHPPLTDNYIITQLNKMNHVNFMYVLDMKDNVSHFDPERKTLSILSKFCSNTRIRQLTYRSFLFVFTDCSFNLPNN